MTKDSKNKGKVLRILRRLALAVGFIFFLILVVLGILIFPDQFRSVQEPRMDLGLDGAAGTHDRRERIETAERPTPPEGTEDRSKTDKPDNGDPSAPTKATGQGEYGEVVTLVRRYPWYLLSELPLEERVAAAKVNKAVEDLFYRLVMLPYETEKMDYEEVMRRWRALNEIYEGLTGVETLYPYKSEMSFEDSLSIWKDLDLASVEPDSERLRTFLQTFPMSREGGEASMDNFTAWFGLYHRVGAAIYATHGDWYAAGVQSSMVNEWDNTVYYFRKLGVPGRLGIAGGSVERGWDTFKRETRWFRPWRERAERKNLNERYDELLSSAFQEERKDVSRE